MSEWRPDITKYIYRHLTRCQQEGKTPIKLRGARRASKTWTVCQWALMQMLEHGDVFVFASMTDEQGRLGAFEDCKNIIASMPDGLGQYYEVGRSPRQIVCRSTHENGKHGVIVFRSFQDPETAKGIACDWVFMNEANKFTQRQYYDLAANARKGVILDYNPNGKFWADDLPNEELVCTWQKNRKHLTQAQLQWFDQIYNAAHSPNATAADWYYYLVYWCGEYSELSGSIFTRGNCKTEDPADVPWATLGKPVLFCDPSALRDADYFPAVVGALDKETGDMWVLDVDSTNASAPRTDGGDPKQERLERMLQMAAQYDGTRLYIEDNGLAGVDFIEKYAQPSGWEWRTWHQTKPKFDRIVNHYQELTRKTHYVDNPRLGAFMEQVYAFAEKCEHDDNIDAVNSLWTVLDYLRTCGE